eukprot:scaffold83815_cov118-Phaeocystis_antarctica.AAC.2
MNAAYPGAGTVRPSSPAQALFENIWSRAGSSPIVAITRAMLYRGGWTSTALQPLEPAASAVTLRKMYRFL